MEWKIAGQHLIKRDSERIKIRTSIQNPFGLGEHALLRTAVLRFADEQIGGGQMHRIFHQWLCDPEVDDLRDFPLPLRQYNQVVRRNVPVNDAVIVSELQTTGRFTNDLNRLRYRDLSDTLEPLPDALATNQLHNHEKGTFVKSSKFEKLQQIGVAQPG